VAACSVALALTGGACSRSPSPEKAAASASAVPAPVAASAAPNASTAAAAPVVPLAEPSASGPPRRSATGEGISITETADGRVIIKTTSLWNEPINTTYTSCEYYRGAVPVLKRQLSEERAKLLTRVCMKGP
jgi:hypothetical protein